MPFSAFNMRPVRSAHLLRARPLRRPRLAHDSNPPPY
jgi:hypothetical protein